MQYIIEVDDELNDLLNSNALARNMTVSALIAELLKRYVIDAHIMEQNELWQSGTEQCKDINLDWANL
ncbi:MAG: hypothetical protein K2J01_02380 [Clostridiales bacterium]|nr:hypothetical protein [Clostridiales bacterium]